MFNPIIHYCSANKSNRNTPGAGGRLNKKSLFFAACAKVFDEVEQNGFAYTKDLNPASVARCAKGDFHPSSVIARLPGKDSAGKHSYPLTHSPAGAAIMPLPHNPRGISMLLTSDSNLSVARRACPILFHEFMEIDMPLTASRAAAVAGKNCRPGKRCSYGK